jgi:hypothetical protein
VRIESIMEKRLSPPKQDSRNAERRESVLEGLVREFSVSARRSRGRKAPSLTVIRSEIESIANQNYSEALRRCLSRWEVREIVEEGKIRVWPDLNHQPVTLVSLEEFVRRWSPLGVDFKFASLSWRQGLSLLGFYVKRTDGGRERPLIFVNTAHHQALVGVALDHEMGHHLTSKIFATHGSEAAPHLLSLTGFKEHLVDPVELAADILVSFGMFPANVARGLFDGRKNRDRGKGLSDSVFAKVLGYVGTRYHFRFDLIAGTEKKFQALAALVHYTKLRRALLDEYRT